MPWLHSAVALLVCCVLILKKNSHSILLTVTIVFSIDSEDVSNPYLHVRRNGILVGHQLRDILVGRVNHRKIACPF